MRRISVKFVLLLVLMGGGVMASDREEVLCGTFQERFLFFLWSSMAPSPDPDRVRGIEHVEAVEFVTGDKKIVRGYRYGAHDNSSAAVEAKGYVLMAMGNAMVADEMVKELKIFAEAGFDVYVYDYRGYANSEGNRRIKAIIEDHKEIAASLNERYERRMLYGTSLGGLIIMNVIGSGTEYDAAVIDSAPSKVSSFGCPSYLDPTSNLPDDASRILVITAQKDRVLGEQMTAPLRIEAQKRGAKTYDGTDYEHPFMDRDPSIHLERMRRILLHLTEGE